MRLCLALTLVLTLDHLCGGQTSAHPKTDRLVMPDIKRIKERGSLIVAQYEGESPPYFFFEKDSQLPESMRLTLHDGRVICGIDIFLARSIAKILHVELDLKRDYPTFRAVIDAVSVGEADLGISDLSLSFERMQSVRFSEPYAVFSFALLVNRHTMLEKKIMLDEKSTDEDFDRYFNKPDCRIAVGRDTSAGEQLFLIFPNAAAVPYNSIEELAGMVGERKIDAVLGDDFSIYFEMLKRPALRLYFDVLKIPDSPEKIAIAVNPDAPTLAMIADEVARCIRINSTKELVAQYGSVLKSLAAENPSASSGSRRPPSADGRRLGVVGSLYEKVSGKKVEFSDSAMAAVGLPLAAFILVWIGMSRRRHHG